MRSFEFKLTEPIKISVNGDFVEADTIVCHSPSAKRKRIASRLRQKFMQAMMSMPEDKRTPEAKAAAEAKKAETEAKAKAEAEALGEAYDPGPEMTGEEIVQMLFMSSIDIGLFEDDFEKLILSPGVAKVEDKDLSAVHIEKISSEDYERLIGEYLKNFFISSWMPKEDSTP